MATPSHYPNETNTAPLTMSRPIYHRWPHHLYPWVLAGASFVVHAVAWIQCCGTPGGSFCRLHSPPPVPQGRHRKSSLWAPRGSVSRHPSFFEWLPLFLSCLGRRHDCDGQPGIMGDTVNIAQVSNHLNLQTEENVIRWLTFPNVRENFIVHSHFIIMFY